MLLTTLSAVDWSTRATMTPPIPPPLSLAPNAPAFLAASTATSKQGCDRPNSDQTGSHVPGSLVLRSSPDYLPARLLCDEGQFQKLTSIQDWIVQEIRAVKDQGLRIQCDPSSVMLNRRKILSPLFRAVYSVLPASFSSSSGRRSLSADSVQSFARSDKQSSVSQGGS